MDSFNDNDVDSFLNKVNEIESIVRGLSSTDENLVSENLRKADQIIEAKYDTEVDGIKTKFGKSRTIINKSALNGPTMGGNSADSGQEAFMRIMESDAQERHKRRQENLKISNELKEKGNIEFQNKNNEKAIEFYSEAIQKAKDNIAAYTNRCQAYIKLGKYKEAIEDCDWALRINEKCVKAMIHKGKALTFLKEFDKALLVFENIKNIEPKQACLVDEYLKELERYRLAEIQEKAAELFLENSQIAKTPKDSTLPSSNVLDILNKLLEVKNQNLWYYSGGIRYLCSLLDNEIKKTLFRTHNGFKLFEDEHILAKYLNNSICLEKLNSNEIDLICSGLELIQVVCSNCDENIRALFQIKNFTHVIETIFEEFGKLSKSNQFSNIENFALSFLNIVYQLVRNEFGYQQILNHFDSNKLLVSLIEISYNTGSSLIVKEKSLLIVQNLALDSKVHSMIKVDILNLLIEKLCYILKMEEIKSSKFICNSILTTIYALTSLPSFRNIITNTEVVWNNVVEIFVMINKKPAECDDTLVNLILCLFTNLTSIKSKFLDNHCDQIVECILKNENNLKNAQALSLLANIVQNASQRQKVVQKIDIKIVSQLLNNIESNNVLNQSLKVLALFSQNEASFCDKIIEVNKDLNALYQTFKDVSQKPIEDMSNFKSVNLKKLNETVINNSVLCISNCVERDVKVAQVMVKSNIIMDLLYLARDGLNQEMRKNCGILIAKLVKKDDRHLERLRELHGIEILHTSLKNINI